MIRRLFRITEQDEDSWSVIAVIQELNHQEQLSCDICHQPIQPNATVVIGERYEALFTNHLDCYEVEER